MRRQFKDFAFLDIPQEVPSFSTVRELFSRLRTTAADIDDAGLNLFGEGELRLEQLNWIIGRIAAVQQADPAGRVMRYRDHRGHVTDSNASDDPMEMEITILCEAFYYLAWRTLAIARRLGVRAESVGIRNARNHLLEHMDENHVKRGWSFVYGAGIPFGPVLRPFGVFGDNISTDVGLYVNARELIDALSAGLARAIDVEKSGA